MASSNGHKSETTSFITTKRDIGMGTEALHFPTTQKLIEKREARKVTEMVRFSQEKTVPLTYMFAMSKYCMGDYVQALCWLD